MLESLSFVIPAYNEESNIAGMVRACERVAPSITPEHEIIVVNDGSTDSTRQVLGELSDICPSLMVVNHETNLGFGPAVRDGLAAVRNRYIFYTDADRQFDLDDIHLLTPHAGEADFVVGYRVRRADPARRRFNALVYNVLVRVFFRVPIRDVDCAFKLIRTDALRSLDIRARTGFLFAEMMQKAAGAGMTIREVPVRHYPRRFGEQTGGNPAVILQVIRDMASYAFLERNSRPLRRYTDS